MAEIDAMTRETNGRTNSVHYLSAEVSGYIAIIHWTRVYV
jgi:hypothetical protein